MDRHGFHRKKVLPTASFGERLTRLRTDKKLTLAAVEDELKIREHHLAHIESCQFDHLPPAYARGFIRNYAQFLGVDADTIDAELVHLDAQASAKSLFKPGLVDKAPRWIITPKTIGIIGVGILFISFIGYITLQVKQFSAPPQLTIINPKAESVVAQELISIEGKTEPGSFVTIDNLDATVAPSGDFRYELTLRPGLNQITIRSANRIKKVSTKVLSVLYEASVIPSQSAIAKP